MLSQYRKLSKRERIELLQAAWRLLIARLCLVAGISRAQRILQGRAAPADTPPAHTALLDWELRARALRRVSSRLPGVHCLTRSLALRWWMRSSGLDARLKIGVRVTDGNTHSHAWVDWGGNPIGEAREFLSDFREIWQAAGKSDNHAATGVEVQPEAALPQPACRLTGSAMARPILIQGIAADELRQRLVGRPEHRPWQQLVERGPIYIGHGADSRAAFQSQSISLERELDEGQVSLVSGGPARLAVKAHHRDSGAMLPRPLYLALSQQWAQDGVTALHAAAFKLDGAGVLAIGAKGAGKSTLTAAVLAAGGRVCSDDWVLVGMHNDIARAERIRSFLMLRAGWASAKLAGAIESISPGHLDGSPRQVIDIPAADHRFPHSVQVDRIWILSRPASARGERSELQAMPPASMQAALIEAGMPILLGSRLPDERAELTGLHRRLVARLRGERLVACTDLINSPKTVLGRLLAG